MIQIIKYINFFDQKYINFYNFYLVHVSDFVDPILVLHKSRICVEYNTTTNLMYVSPYRSVLHHIVAVWLICNRFMHFV